MKTLEYAFVRNIPARLEGNTLYISVEFATAVHLCACGCAEEVVTPLSPTDWKLIFDGETVSLNPSIGNWSYDCQSHYWIRKNSIVWAPKWSKEEIAAGREKDRGMKDEFYSTYRIDRSETQDNFDREPFWQRIRRWFHGRE
ncbi:MAG: hypothetical protein IPM59_03825 [Chloracidobacterium sp.]|nr:hypothetical protein [Chloracidobacterium sp.]